jgi:hypothetical protein
VFDGTVKGLIDAYKTHPESPIHQLSYASRENYKAFFNYVEEELGPERVENVNEDRVRRAYERWSSNDRLSMGFGLTKALGRLATFGDTVLKDRACRELRIVLGDLKFPRPKARDERLTREMANNIRRVAHAWKLPSIAIAQAFQSDLGLRQRDVIGEWVPIDEEGVSGVHVKNKKWIRGICWNEIEDWVLRHDGKEYDLRSAKMVMEELAAYNGKLPTTATPIIVSERTNKPWGPNEFRKAWRKIADEAGVPPGVRNQDSRRGGLDDDNDEASHALEK